MGETVGMDEEGGRGVEGVEWGGVAGGAGAEAGAGGQEEDWAEVGERVVTGCNRVGIKMVCPAA